MQKQRNPQSRRGGKREGAGRPKGTGKFGEPTKAVRLPISMIDDVMNYVSKKVKKKQAAKT